MDGSDEAVIFLSHAGHANPLKIYIYQKVDDEFVQAAVIEGQGTSFESVNYIDMNDDGFKEIVVGRQISTAMKSLTVYSTEKFQMSVLLSTDYIEYMTCRMYDSKYDDLFVIRNGADQEKEAEIGRAHV